MSTYKKICAYCGKTFETNYKQRKYCNDQCTYTANLSGAAERRRRHNEKKKQGKVNKRIPKSVVRVRSPLAAFNSKARAAGMTYGLYEAWQQSQKEMKERQAEREQGIRFLDRFLGVL